MPLKLSNILNIDFKIRILMERYVSHLDYYKEEAGNYNYSV